MKKLTIIAFAMICGACGSWADNNNSVIPENDKRYVIEATGEFEKELKNLVKKYSKDENVTVNVYRGNEPVYDDSRLLNIGVNRNQYFNLTAGEQAYVKNCKNCHGEKGTKRASINTKRLSDLSAEDIEAAVIKYASDATYGGSGKGIMRVFAQQVSYKDLGNIIAYLKGENAYIFEEDEDDSGNGDVQTTPTEQGTYLQ